MKARKRNSWRIIGLWAVILACSTSKAAPMNRWDFNEAGDLQGWTGPSPGENTATVMGGSLWLSLAPKAVGLAAIGSDPEYPNAGMTVYEAFGDGRLGAVLATSPPSLGLSSASVTQVRLRVLNLSSLTDFFLRWKTRQTGWGGDQDLGWGQPPQSRRCTLKADDKEWQEITCYIDKRWQGTLDQLEILSAQRMLRGDLWIDWFEIVKGPPEPVRLRPDVAGAVVVPRISIPGLTQAGFSGAFEVLDKCMTVDVPIFGFNYPVMSPGGYYTQGGWWLMDSALALEGAKWTNSEFAENVMRGFSELQAANPDGRIDLMGQHGIRGQPGDLSQYPSYFDVAYHIAQRTSDAALRGQIYESMRKFLDWWLSPSKRDSGTGLIAGIFEEAAPARTMSSRRRQQREYANPLTMAQVDLNVMVAVGAARVAALANTLKKADEASQYYQVFQDLSDAINTYLWNDQDGVYLDYDLRLHQQQPGLNVTIFDPLRLRIAPSQRRERLLKRLLDTSQFNWSRRPLTSRAMTDPDYVEAKGGYNGDQWLGNIWTIRNMTVVAGLEESGRPDLAAELNWATIKEFHGNYREYVLPSTGQGQGADDFAWSASQYVAAVVDHLFGIEFDAAQKRLLISPHVPLALYRRAISLNDLILTTQEASRLSVTIRQMNANTATVALRISGSLPEGSVQIILPGTRNLISTPVRANMTVRFPSK